MRKLFLALLSVLMLFSVTQAVTLTIVQPDGTVTMTRPAGSEITFKDLTSQIIWWKVIEGDVEVIDGGFTMPNEDVTVEAMYTGNVITVIQNTGGTISPGTVGIENGGSRTFTITPNSGYKIATVLVDGISQTVTDETGMTYPFTNVTANHEISATFEVLTENKLRILDKYSMLQTVKMGMDEIALSSTTDTFSEWEGKGIEIENPTDSSLTMNMPNNDAEITLKQKPTLKLTLDKYTVIETEKESGETINLSVTLEEGEVFGGWLAKGVELEPMTLTQSFTMPNNNVEIILSKRSSGQGPLLKLDLGDMSEIETEKTIGQTITLDSSIVGDETFISWDVYGVEISNPTADTITFTMPSNDVYIKINY